eukprot:scaffold71_cov247-Pinguiococcus_pyrenoidosus.AAC.17
MVLKKSERASENSSAVGGEKRSCQKVSSLPPCPFAPLARSTAPSPSDEVLSFFKILGLPLTEQPKLADPGSLKKSSGAAGEAARLLVSLILSSRTREKHACIQYLLTCDPPGTSRSPRCRWRLLQSSGRRTPPPSTCP